MDTNPFAKNSCYIQKADVECFIYQIFEYLTMCTVFSPEPVEDSAVNQTLTLLLWSLGR